MRFNQTRLWLIFTLSAAKNNHRCLNYYTILICFYANAMYLGLSLPLSQYQTLLNINMPLPFIPFHVFTLSRIYAFTHLRFHTFTLSRISLRERELEKNSQPKHIVYGTSGTNYYIWNNFCHTKKLNKNKCSKSEMSQNDEPQQMHIDAKAPVTLKESDFELRTQPGFYIMCR